MVCNEYYFNAYLFVLVKGLKVSFVESFSIMSGRLVSLTSWGLKIALSFGCLLKNSVFFFVLQFRLLESLQSLLVSVSLWRFLIIFLFFLLVSYVFVRLYHVDCSTVVWLSYVELN